jgi:hypothetical protein
MAVWLLGGVLSHAHQRLVAFQPEPDKVAATRAVSELAARAIDLGAPGPDPVYGFGLVGGDTRPELALVGTRGN